MAPGCAVCGPLVLSVSCPVDGAHGSCLPCVACEDDVYPWRPALPLPMSLTLLPGMVPPRQGACPPLCSHLYLAACECPVFRQQGAWCVVRKALRRAKESVCQAGALSQGV